VELWPSIEEVDCQQTTFYGLVIRPFDCRFNVNGYAVACSRLKPQPQKTFFHKLTLTRSVASQDNNRFNLTVCSNNEIRLHKA
jgi:hypothetical protein